jgi:hypothetical protein
MANNFKLVGSIYIAKPLAGHDSNNGTTPNTPKASCINHGSTGDHIVGAGHYLASGTMDGGRTYRADGIVILESPTTGNFNINFGGNGPGTITGFKRLIRINFANGSGSSGSRTVSACTLDSCSGGGGAGSAYFNFSSNIIINSVLGSLTTANHNQKYSRNVFINSVITCRHSTGGTGSTGDFKSNYVDNASIVRISTEYLPANFRNNNINGVIEFIGDGFGDSTARFYAIQDELTGTPQDNGYDSGVQWLTQSNLTADGWTGAITGWNTAVGTCMNKDPKFNNPSIEDYTLQADSPHIGAGEAGVNIGRFGIGVSVINTDDGIGDTEVITTPEIDTSIPLSFQLDTEEIEGYVQYTFKVGSSPIVPGPIDPLVAFNFNTSSAGGTTGNNNVPDSEPLSIDYPRKLTTTSAAPNTVTLVVSGNDAVVGEWVRVNGQDREITDVVGDDITVASAFASSIGSGVTFQIATESQLGALRPNRLTYLMRTSVSTSKPTVDADWDNSIDPIYDADGLFLTQEWGRTPGYIIDNLDGNKVYGAGDSDAPDITVSDISAIWFQIRVYLRNDYES